MFFYNSDPYAMDQTLKMLHVSSRGRKLTPKHAALANALYQSGQHKTLMTLHFR